MATKKANAVQRKWMEDIADWAQENIGNLYGYEWSGKSFELHHVLGRSAKHNKVGIGHEFIIPVPFELHNVLENHPDNVTHFKKNFVKRFGMQRELFDKMYESMESHGYAVPVFEIYLEIMRTSA